MTVTLDEKTVSLRLADGLIVEITFQIEASGVVVPKSPPVPPRRLAELKFDIGAAALEGNPSVAVSVLAELKDLRG